MKRYREKEEAIRQLYSYEEEHNIPEEERLTLDAYAGIPCLTPGVSLRL